MYNCTPQILHPYFSRFIRSSYIDFCSPLVPHQILSNYRPHDWRFYISINPRHHLLYIIRIFNGSKLIVTAVLRTVIWALRNTIELNIYNEFSPTSRSSDPIVTFFQYVLLVRFLFRSRVEGDSSPMGSRGASVRGRRLRGASPPLRHLQSPISRLIEVAMVVVVIFFYYRWLFCDCDCCVSCLFFFCTPQKILNVT